MKKNFYVSSLLFIGSLLFSVAANATVPTVTSDPANASVCSGTHVNFVVAAIDTPGTLPITFSWQVSTDGGTIWSTITDTTYYAGTSNDTLDVTASMMLNGYMYRAIATNTDGADTSAGATLMVDTLYAGAIGGPSSVCRSGTITLTSTVPGGTWTSDDLSMATITSGGVVTGMPTAFGYDSIFYSVTNVCGTATSWTVLHVDSFVYAQPITGPSATCVGNFITLSNLNTVGTGVWSSSNPAVAAVSGTGVVAGVGHGTATITYDFTTACNMVTSISSVSVDTVLAPAIITGAAGVCVGSSTHLSASVGGGTWFCATSSIAIVDGSGNVTGVATGSVPVLYFITNSCGSSIATHNITVSAPVSAIFGLDSVGIGQNRTYTNLSPGGAWTISDTTIATIDSTGKVTGVDTGSVTITYTVSNFCGASSATLVIAVGPQGTIPAITGPDTACIGVNTTYTHAYPGGVWTTTDTFATINMTTGVFNGISAGVAHITYTWTNGFGPAQTVKTIIVRGAPANNVSGPLAVTSTGNITLRATPFGGTWSLSNTHVATILAVLDSAHLTSFASIYVLTTGVDTATYTVSNSCGTSTNYYVINYSLVGVNTITKDAGEMNIYPNPSNGVFTVNLAADNNEAATVVITDILGKKVEELSISTNKNFNVRLNVPAGVYFLSAHTASGSYSGRITVTQ